MKSPAELETDAIRSDIDHTRRHMDDTMEAIGDRLHGRHLLDEVVGFIRRQPERARKIRRTVTDSASQAAHAVGQSVREHPLPAALIGAGLAWFIYDRARRMSAGHDREEAADDFPASAGYDPDEFYDRPLEYSARAAMDESSAGGYGMPDPISPSSPDSAPASAGGSRAKLHETSHRVAEKATQMKEKLGEASSRLRETARDLGDRAAEGYERSRERVAHTASERPIELGLACLAVGLIAGLALPTPRRLDRLAGPTMDRLRQRARDNTAEFLQKGRRAASAAVGAARAEVAQPAQEGQSFQGQSANEPSRQPNVPPTSRPEA